MHRDRLGAAYIQWLTWCGILSLSRAAHRTRICVEQSVASHRPHQQLANDGSDLWRGWQICLATNYLHRKLIMHR
jgi:hypothetical protein